GAVQRTTGHQRARTAAGVSAQRLSALSPRPRHLAGRTHLYWWGQRFGEIYAHQDPRGGSQAKHGRYVADGPSRADIAAAGIRRSAWWRPDLYSPGTPGADR